MAGLYDAKTKTMTVIIPEEVPDAAIEDYAVLIIKNMSLENKNIIYQKKVALNNIEAYQIRMNGEINGLRCSYLVTIFSKDDFYFQVVSWWLPDLVPIEPREIRLICSSFGFTPGIKPKTTGLRSFSVLPAKL